jgi:polyferredoxin/formate hydrogenlyase subunit 6/NADH:ubiquinone oxidoreductase subunit I
MKKLWLARRLTQGFFLALFVYILWSTTYPLKSRISSEIFFKLDPLLMIIVSLSERFLIAGTILALVMLLAALVLGRFFCGWVCPLGTVIDFSGRDNKGVKISDSKISQLRKMKFLILSLVFFCCLLGIQLAWVFDPITIAGRFVSLNFIPAVTYIINGFFTLTIRTFHLYGGLYDLYRDLRSSLLGVKVYYFSHAILIFSLFLAIFIAGYKLKRSWCRIVCPLGALYALFSKFSLIERRVDTCNHCRKCHSNCRMGAIKEDNSYVKSECVLCMDCVYDCPNKSTHFRLNGWQTGPGKKPDGNVESGITRRQFLALAVFSGISSRLKLKDEILSSGKRKQRVLRPPASLKEEEFIDCCVRCGNCMKVCITNGLQPTMLESGVGGVWTPRLVPEIGYCEYHCTLCGNVCPTGAIPKLTEPEKLKTRLGLPKIDRNICIPWKRGEPCLVCEEHCPIPSKAIKLKKAVVNGKIITRPYLNLSLCIGCGICQTKCPTRPERAIKVFPVRVTHGKNQLRPEEGVKQNEK